MTKEEAKQFLETHETQVEEARKVLGIVDVRQHRVRVLLNELEQLPRERAYQAWCDKRKEIIEFVA